MNQATFEASRRATWIDFDTELQGYEKSVNRSQSSDSERSAFIESYESVSADLVIAKSRGYAITLISYLNDLVMRGHYVVQSTTPSRMTYVRSFIMGGFAREVRDAKVFVLIAAAAFLIPGLFIGLLIQFDPSFVHTVMGPSALNSLESMYSGEHDRLGRERSDASDLQMFGFYIYNNVRIGFITFAGGLLFCVFAIFVLAYNGLAIAAALSHLIVIGSGANILRFVAGHSALELTGILLAGAAGLMLGYSLIHPGSVSRKTALRQSGKSAGFIMLGVTFMLISAAAIEAFWSSLRLIPDLLKYTVGITLWLLTLLYFLMAGRNAN